MAHALTDATDMQYSLKMNLFHYTLRRRLGERSYSFYSFSTSALDGGEWSTSRPGRALPPGKGPPVPIVQEDERAPEPVWTQRLQEKSFAAAGDRKLDSPVVQTVARHWNTAWTAKFMSAPKLKKCDVRYKRVCRFGVKERRKSREFSFGIIIHNLTPAKW
jgi:hypothetical protein